MKNNKIFAMLMLGLFATVSPLAIHAQTSLPREVALFVTPEKFPDMDARLYPLGWSKDAKFAWLTSTPMEAGEEEHWTLTVQNMDTNKQVEKAEFEIEAKTPGIKACWAKHGKAISAALAKHGIALGAPLAMDHFPLLLGGRRGTVFNPQIEAQFGVGVDEVEGVKSFSLTLREEDKSTPFHEQGYEKIFPLAIHLAGSFASPDGKYLALVPVACWRGYEGAPHIRRVETLVGYEIK